MVKKHSMIYVQMLGVSISTFDNDGIWWHFYEIMSDRKKVI